jgi:putative FmdB family regulatory protein
MPIYEYECTSCCKVIEVIQRMTEDPLTNCPDCSGTVNKLVSKSSFQLKGGGWYADGYSSKSSNGSGSTPKDKSTKDKSTKNSSPKAEKTTSSSSDSSATTKSKADCSATA